MLPKAAGWHALLWRPGGNNKDEKIEERREVSNGRGEEASRVDDGWSEVSQDNVHDEDGDEEEADRAVVRGGRDGGEGKVVRPDIYCAIAGM